MESKTMFELGQLIVTPAAFELLQDENISPDSVFERHALGDWDDMKASDKDANYLALDMGGRILSVYRLPSGEEIWVTTDPERVATTILLPSEH
jgi:hypothetical protein